MQQQRHQSSDVLGGGSSRTRTAVGRSCLRRQGLIYVDRPLRVWLREGGVWGGWRAHSDNPTTRQPTTRQPTTRQSTDHDTTTATPRTELKKGKNKDRPRNTKGTKKNGEQDRQQKRGGDRRNDTKRGVVFTWVGGTSFGASHPQETTPPLIDLKWGG